MIPPLQTGIRSTSAKMEGGVSGFPGMIVLNSHNYSDWKIKMEDLLIVKDLYQPIDRSHIPTGVLEFEWNVLNRKAVATIRQCVDVSVLQHVANDTKANEMWHKLSRLYKRKNALNQKYRDGECIVVHINTFMGLMNQLAAAKFPLDDVVQDLLLLCTFPDNWENPWCPSVPNVKKNTCSCKW